MNRLFIFFIALAFHVVVYGQDWEAIKDTLAPELHLSELYEAPYQQPLSVIGWEDGVHISSNGLYLYCTYAPIDLLSFVINDELPTAFSENYDRGAPDFGMDLVTNPLGADEWLHSDILIAQRSSITELFSSWELSAMARPVFSEGAPMPLFDSDTTIEKMLYTSNDNYSFNQDIWMIEMTNFNPAGIGDSLHPPVNTGLKEDNPNITRLSDSELMLIWDTDEYADGAGDLDLWFSRSTDNGLTWSEPTNVAALNTADVEHQPFLFLEPMDSSWYLYFSANHTDGKLAIFRSKQINENDWDNWEERELVLSAGNASGVGEPTLTNSGDLSFVLVCADPEESSIYNRFDADAWYLPRKDFSKIVFSQAKINVKCYPNPTRDMLYFQGLEESADISIQLIDSQGRILLEQNHNGAMDIGFVQAGFYFCVIQTSAGRVEKQIVKK